MGGRLERERAEAGATRRGANGAAARALRCRRGAHAVEFALVATGLFTLLLGAAEMMWQGLTGLAVENAILQASRAGSLGCLQPDGTRAGQAGPQQIRSAAVTAGAGILNAAALNLTTTAYNSLTNAAARSGGANGSVGVGGQFVEYTLTYVQPVLFAGRLLGRSNYTFSGTITIRNEPFNNGGAGAQACA